jgi:hypothetical protein
MGLRQITASDCRGAIPLMIAEKLMKYISPIDVKNGLYRGIFA